MKHSRIQLGLFSIAFILFFTACQNIRAAKSEEVVSHSDERLQRLVQALETENQEELIRLAKEKKVILPKQEKSQEKLNTIETKSSLATNTQIKEIKIENSVKKEELAKVENKAVKKALEEEKVKNTVAPKIAKEEKKVERKEETKVASSSKTILMIGDSVMEGSKLQLKKMYPNAIIDSSVSRQFTVLPEILRKTKAQHGDLPNLVVIHLGSNGTVGEKQMKEAMQILGDRRVFFLNTKVEKPWQNPVNEFLRKQVEKYPNASLVNWYETSKEGKYFAKDGVHPNKEGAQLYRNLIQKTLEKEL